MPELPATVTDPALRERLMRKLDGLASESREYRRKHVEADWNLVEAYFQSQHWPDKPAEGYVPRITDNQLFKFIFQELALLTDSKGRASVVPAPLTHSGDEFALWLEHSARMLDQMTQAVWQQTRVDEEREKAILDQQLKYKGFLKVIWDPAMGDGLGDVRVVRLNPWTVYVDPNATTFDDAYYLRLRVPRSIDYIERKWPWAKGLVEPDVELSAYEIDSPTAFFGRMGTRRYPGDKSVRQSQIPRAWVEEFWIRDLDEDEVRDGEETITRLRYPGGRVVQRVGDVLLDDFANPFLDADWPLVEIPAWPPIEKFWEAPDPIRMIPMQDVTNKMWSITVANAVRMASGKWKGERDALTPDEWDALDATPGGLIRLKPGRTVSRDQGAALPDYVQATLGRAVQHMAAHSGVLDPPMGKPGGMTPQGFIDSFVLAMQASLRFKERAIERADEQVGRKIIARILQFYRGRRILSYEGEAGWQSLTWDRDQIVPASDRVNQDDMIRWVIKRFQYRVVPGSGLALSREKVWAISAALFGMGVIDAPALLEDVQYPRREEVLRRMAAAQQAKQKHDMMMAMLGVPPQDAKKNKPVRSAVPAMVKSLTRGSANGRGR